MRPSSFTHLAAVIVVAVLADPTSFVEAETTQLLVEKSSLSARGVTRVEVRVARGSLTVRGTDTDRIEMQITRSSDVEDPRKVVVQTAQTGEVVRVVAVHPPPPSYPIGEPFDHDPELGDFWLHDITVDVELSVPAHTEIWLRTMRGNLRISSITESIDVATNLGDIQLLGMKGSVKASATGDVSLEWTALSSASLSSRVSVYAGNIQLRIPRGESLQMRGRRVLSPMAGEVELVRAEGVDSFAGLLTLGRRNLPLVIDLNGGSLFLASPSRSQ